MAREPREGRDRGERRDRDGDDLVDKLVAINRVAKVVKGGRRFAFAALVVVGDKKGKVGIGLGKAGEVADAIRKGGEDAKQRMIPISLHNATIPHEVLSEFGGARVGGGHHWREGMSEQLFACPSARFKVG